MAGNDSAKQGRAKVMYICSSPEGLCNGKKTVEKDSPSRLHSSPQECLACNVRALLAQGYRKIGARQFEHMTDDSKPIITIDKHATRAKPGKQANAYYAKGSRIRNKCLTKQERDEPFDPEKAAAKMK